MKYLNPADHHPATKADKDFSKWINFKDIKFSVKTRDIQKIERKELHWHYCFWLWKKGNAPIFSIKKMLWSKICWLIGEAGTKHYVLINDYNILMHINILLREKKHFCRYCLQAFIKEEILKHIKDCLKINGKQNIITPTIGEYVNTWIHSKVMEEK